MKPAAFDYIRAGDLTEVLEALDKHGSDARIIAGGQSLLPMLNMRLAKPAVLIDIMNIAGLDRIGREGDATVVSAGVRQAVLMRRPGLAGEQPLLAAALPWLGHYQTLCTRYGLRLSRPCRSQRRDPTLPRRARWRDPAAFAPQAAQREGERILRRHDGDRQGR